MPKARGSGLSEMILVGAPPAKALDEALARHPGGGLIFEPDPERAAELSRTCPETVDVVAGLPGASDETAVLTQYSLPGLRAMRPATQHMRTLYPGLQVRGELQAKRLSPSSLKTAARSLAGPVRLYIDLPGEEREVLEALEGAGLLEAVEDLCVGTALKPVFEGGADVQAVAAWLDQRGFALASIGGDDSELPTLSFTRSALFQTARAAQTELETAREQLKDAEAMAERIGELEKKLTDKEQDRHKQHKDAETKGARVAELEAIVNQRDKKIEELSADVSLSLRMQRMAQTDLRNLSDRFREADAERRAQAELLRKLTPRLQHAAMRLQELTQQDEPPAQALDGPVDAAVPASEKADARSSVSKSKRTRKRSKK